VIKYGTGEYVPAPRPKKKMKRPPATKRDDQQPAQDGNEAAGKPQSAVAACAANSAISSGSRSREHAYRPKKSTAISIDRLYGVSAHRATPSMVIGGTLAQLPATTLPSLRTVVEEATAAAEEERYDLPATDTPLTTVPLRSSTWAQCARTTLLFQASIGSGSLAGSDEDEEVEQQPPNEAPNRTGDQLVAAMAAATTAAATTTATTTEAAAAEAEKESLLDEFEDEEGRGAARARQINRNISKRKRAGGTPPFWLAQLGALNPACGSRPTHMVSPDYRVLKNGQVSVLIWPFLYFWSLTGVGRGGGS
jgi:hypothetical protein